MVRIMTDNAANLPPELREQYNIRELRLTYTVDGKLIDGSAPFDGHDFYEAMRRGAEVKTSMISPAAARDAIEPALAAGDDVLFLGISGGVSGTCWGVGLIAQELTAEYPGRRVQVLDTRGASLGEGLVVLEAAQMAQQGADMDTIIARAETLCGKMRQHFMVDDLKFPARADGSPARRPWPARCCKSSPSCKAMRTARSWCVPRSVAGKKAMDTLVALYNELVEDKSAPVGLSHAAAPAEALHLTTLLRQSGCTGPILTVCHEPRHRRSRRPGHAGHVLLQPHLALKDAQLPHLPHRGGVKTAGFDGGRDMPAAYGAMHPKGTCSASLTAWASPPTHRLPKPHASHSGGQTRPPLNNRAALRRPFFIRNLK